jgi:hypothetical protein
MYNPGFMAFHPAMYGPPPTIPPPVMSPKLNQPVADLELRRAYQWPTTSSRIYRGIGDFDLSHPLGKGGFSQVFRGKSKKDGKTYAVKKVALA